MEIIWWNGPQDIDIHSSIKAIHNSVIYIMYIHNSNMDAYKLVMYIHNSVIYISITYIQTCIMEK